MLIVIVGQDTMILFSVEANLHSRQLFGCPFYLEEIAVLKLTDVKNVKFLFSHLLQFYLQSKLDLDFMQILLGQQCD